MSCLCFWFVTYCSTVLGSSPVVATSKKPVTRRRQIVDVSKMVCVLVVDWRFTLTSDSGSTGSTVPTVYRKVPTSSVSTIIRLPPRNAQDGTLDVEGKPQTGKEDVGIISSGSARRARTRSCKVGTGGEAGRK